MDYTSEVLDACPFCRCAESALVFEVNDSGFLIRLRKCSDCSLVFLNPRLTPEALESLEDTSEYYVVPEKTRAETVAKLEDMVLGLQAYAPRRGRLLDIGCNRGFMLEAARRRGWEKLVGVEISRVAAEEARTRYGFPVFSAVPDAALDGPYDLAVGWHVLEHTLDPVGFLRDIASVLAPDGVLAVQVPDFESLGWFEARAEISKIVNRVHNFQFSGAALGSMLEAAGFQPLLVQRSETDGCLTAIATLKSSPAIVMAPSPSPGLSVGRLRNLLRKAVNSLRTGGPRQLSSDLRAYVAWGRDHPAGTRNWASGPAHDEKPGPRHAR